MRCPRTIATMPSSSGWRSASSAARLNSDSSSRNSTPWCASVASPGCGTDPPPTRPAGEIVWCGARNGRWRTSSSPTWRPATLWMRVTAIASSRVSGGRIEIIRRASIVLPVPGGPGQQEVVPARGGDRQRADRPRVAADVGQVGLARRGRRPRGAGGGSSGGGAAAQDRRDLAQVRHAGDLEPVDERRLARALARHDEAGDPGVPRAFGDAEHAAAVAQLAAERPARRTPPSGPGRPPAAARRRRARRTRWPDRSRGRPCAGARARG